MLSVIFVIIGCYLALELEIGHQETSHWEPVNDQLMEWLLFPEELDPHTYKLDLNKATMRDFETLSGIGPAKARAIVSYRQSLADGFTDIEQMMQVDGIGEKTFANLQPQLTLSGDLNASFPQSCTDLEQIKVRPLLPQQQYVLIPGQELGPLCQSLWSAREIVEDDVVHVEMELKLIFESGEERVLYCSEDWKVCKLDDLQLGTAYGLSLQNSRQFRQVMYSRIQNTANMRE